MRKRRGISLILALFTVAVLITLSITFLALAHNESRSSRSGYYQAASLQACNWALDYLINYMQAPPNLTGGGSMQFTSLTDRYFTLRLQAGDGMPDGLFRGYPIRVVPGTTSQRRIFFGSEADPFRIPIGNDLEATVDMDFNSVTVDSGLIEGQPQRYTVSIRSRIFPRAGDSMLASRQVDVRLLEDSPTRRKTNENDVSWDVQGNVPGTRDELAIRVGIPSDYTETMPVRIEGHLGDPNITQSWYDASGRIRYLFDPSAAGASKFRQGVAIAQSTNLNRTGQPVDPNSDAGMFSGGINRLAPRLGLPQSSEPGEVFPYITKRDESGTVHRGYAQFKASQIGGAGARSGFIEVDSTGGNMRTGQINPDGSISFSGQPTIDTGANDNDALPQGVTLPPGTQSSKVEVRNAIEVDPRSLSDNPAIKANANNTPGIPNIVVTLGQGTDGDRVSVQVEGKYSGQLTDIPGYQNVPATSFKEGILYIKGGNVKVVTEPGKQFNGHLTIVSGEGTDREPVSIAANGTPNYDNQTTIYHQAARDYFEARNADGQLLHRGESGPPYTAAQLGLPGDPNRLYYPPPKPGVEREGNVVVGSDLTYAENKPSVLGLVSQNFIMLNDRNYAAELPNPTMKVDAALFSFEHSVQFDWDNTAGNPDFLSKREIQKNLVGLVGLEGDPGTPPQAIVTKSGRTFVARDSRILNAQGKIELRGSVTSRFADVEGAYLQMSNTHAGQTYTANPHFGYTDQSLFNYPYQTHVLPPNFPRYNLTNSQIPFTVENYVDRGAFSTEGTAN